MSYIGKCDGAYVFHLFIIVLIFKILYRMHPFSLEWVYLSIGYIMLFFIIASFSFPFTKRKYLNQKVSTENKAVFITGCDSGFGHLLSIILDLKGYHVFAGCHRESSLGAQALREKCSNRLRVLAVEVSSDSSVQSAFKYIKNELGPLELWAVVNNAGVQKNFHADFCSIEDYEQSIDVNCLGILRVTKTFLPLLAESKGRIINVTSLLGRAVYPGLSPYITSKNGAAMLSDCLRLELSEWGIRVISVEPATFRTKMVDNVIKKFEDMAATLDPDTKLEYGEPFLSATAKVIAQDLTISESLNNQIVMDSLEEAIGNIYTDEVYKPKSNSNQHLLNCVYERLPTSLKCAWIGYINKRSDYFRIVPQRAKEYKQNC